MNLFETATDLETSGFLYRITDNGGETYDRITVTFCDGDYILCTDSTICAHGERGDVQVDSEAVEAGVSRDLRWIDLDPYLQRAIIADLNSGFADWIATAPAAASRDEADDWDGTWKPTDNACPIYCDSGKFYIRDDERDFADDGETNAGAFDTFADAVRRILPQDYDLAGPEYHTTVNLWDTGGGRVEMWDRETDPPVIEAGHDLARAAIVLETKDPTTPEGFRVETIAWFANLTDAENFLGTSATIDPDALEAGHYTIGNLDDPDAPTCRI